MCWGVPMIAPCSLRWAQERSHRKNQHGISCETVLTKFMDDEALTELKKSVNLVSREPHVLVSSYGFNACHIPERTQCWIQYSTNPRQDCVGLSQILQNLMSLPACISELTELNAVWLQPPFQKSHPSCALYSCGIFNQVYLLFLHLQLNGCLFQAKTIQCQL